MRQRSLILRETIHPYPSHQPPGNFEKTMAKPLEKPQTIQTNNNKRTEPHIVQQNKQQQKTF
jgi:hypothetical protein